MEGCDWKGLWSWWSLARDNEVVIGDGDLEVLGHLVMIDHLADGNADRILARAMACWHV